MLETIREYAREQLADVGRGRRAPRRHATFFAALAEEAYAHRFDAEAEWSARLELDHDDLRAALDWLASARRRRARSRSPARWAGSGSRTAFSPRAAGGSRRRSRGSAHGSRTGPRADRARARSLRGRGDVDAGRAQLDEAIALWRELGDRDELASALDTLGWLLVYDAGDNPGALRRSSGASSFAGSSATRRRDARARRRLPGARRAGRGERAEALSRELLERAAGDPRTEHFAYHFLADCALIRGDTVEAGRATARACGRRSRSATSSRRASRCRAWRWRPRAAATRARALPRRVGRGALGVARHLDLGRLLGRAPRALHRTGARGARRGVDAVCAEGRALPFDDAVELALSADPQMAAPQSPLPQQL